MILVGDCNRPPNSLDNNILLLSSLKSLSKAKQSLNKRKELPLKSQLKSLKDNKVKHH